MHVLRSWVLEHPRLNVVLKMPRWDVLPWRRRPLLALYTGVLRRDGGNVFLHALYGGN